MSFSYQKIEKTLFKSEILDNTSADKQHDGAPRDSITITMQASPVRRRSLSACEREKTNLENRYGTKAVNEDVAYATCS